MSIIIYDGYCNLCSGLVHFIVKKDKQKKFDLLPLQSEKARKILKPIELPEQLDSVIYYQNNKIYTRSSAVLKIVTHLNWFWKPIYIFYVIPKPIRDFIYTYIANHRARWFGRRSSCYIPEKE